ncbi:MAG: NAD(P)-binding domain-containing protein [Pedococcus sp.]
MPAIDTVVLGAGHAGLAVSRLLSLEGRDHVVLDRGRVAESWRTARWDSLHLLTPNWMARLPGWAYDGTDSDGFMSACQFARYLERYAASFSAPVLAGVRVEEVSESGDRYRVVTDCATWLARHVVVATGPGSRPRVPNALQGLGPDVHLTAAADYRNPRQLADGGVLVVGASASGVQIADELAAAGREVVLAVGRHNRLPREYRGMDIYWWLERTGVTARTIDEVRDADAARREPSMQLVGRRRHHGQSRELDVRTLQARGVRLAGHLVGAQGQRVSFADDLADSVGDADNRMHRFLDTVDRHVEANGLTGEVWPAERPRGIALHGAPAGLDLANEGIGTVLLATGYSPSYPWLKLPITAADGSIRQVRGRTEAPGVYVVGQRFQHRRDSGMVDGARHDAAQVVADIVGAARVSEQDDQSEALDERFGGRVS